MESDGEAAARGGIMNWDGEGVRVEGGEWKVKAGSEERMEARGEEGRD